MEKKPNMEKEQERQRFVDFLGVKPDLTEIAEKTGILRQTLYYLTKQDRTFVTGEIHRKMAAAYPSYDPSWIMFGIRRASHKMSPVGGEGANEESTDHPANRELPASASDVKLLEVENAGLKRENELLRQTVEILRGVVGDQLKKDMESKSESVNDSTRGKQLAIGLNWGIKKANSPMIQIPFTSVRPVVRTWPVSLRRQP